MRPTAMGMPPIPSWTQLPSPTNFMMLAAICLSIPVGGTCGASKSIWLSGASTM